MIPALEWHIFYMAFERFASMARKYHFYDSEIADMEASIFKMSPVYLREE